MSIEAQRRIELDSKDPFKSIASNNDYPVIIISGFKSLGLALLEDLRFQSVERWKLRQLLIYKIDIGVDEWDELDHQTFRPISN